ncbi:hypothetical protein EV667_1265 [Ancylobacter aquaticus]|uniref:Uncharacterized protein n=1 Tax=Ancylobacter aquaticus TaxID=100 RepID=A0A4R1ID00_ANCAQ|nr:hypothetical protein [Ancylobacter aquaticus]TCK31159.1 hypothetical protein EV667_1265 [Ancylobacter aquaticus]
MAEPMGEVAPSHSTFWSWGAGIAAILVFGAAIGLWARHGAAVFFDMLTAGLAYCF